MISLLRYQPHLTVVYVLDIDTVTHLNVVAIGYAT